MVLGMGVDSHSVRYLIITRPIAPPLVRYEPPDRIRRSGIPFGDFCNALKGEVMNQKEKSFLKSSWERSVRSWVHFTTGNTLPEEYSVDLLKGYTYAFQEIMWVIGEKEWMRLKRIEILTSAMEDKGISFDIENDYQHPDPELKL